VGSRLDPYLKEGGGGLVKLSMEEVDELVPRRPTLSLAGDEGRKGVWVRIFTSQKQFL
jgi:hypothetical protein